MEINSKCNSRIFKLSISTTKFIDHESKPFTEPYYAFSMEIMTSIWNELSIVNFKNQLEHHKYPLQLTLEQKFVVF